MCSLETRAEYLELGALLVLPAAASPPGILFHVLIKVSNCRVYQLKLRCKTFEPRNGCRQPYPTSHFCNAHSASLIQNNCCFSKPFTLTASCTYPGRDRRHIPALQHHLYRDYQPVNFTVTSMIPPYNTAPISDSQIPILYPTPAFDIWSTPPASQCCLLLNHHKTMKSSTPLLNPGLIAWEQGFEFVQVHSDCSEAVNLLTASYANNSPLSLVRAIDNLRQKGWATDIAWIPRACNKPADRLATTVDSRQLDLLCLTSPPTALISFC
ncbi:hypothetical protein V6N12_072585 [Hibiscus sabdariffa]|uniref:RNase H type-1 domain-containing protein n=1 Tax=Hibiscus sabdariffa TaxID=183260 RepID=A0ABR2AZZ3_9ROSI